MFCVSGFSNLSGLKTSAILALLSIPAALSGCSPYPIPDDVIDIGTEHIVRHARCEMRSAIIAWFRADKRINAVAHDESSLLELFKKTVEKVEKLQKINQKRRPENAIDIDERLSVPEKLVRKYGGVAMVYAFDFNITEENKKSADAGFKLPFTPAPAELAADANAAATLKRQGQRQFKASDRWGNLVLQKERCVGVAQRDGNIAYPLGGSIGVGRVVRTFLDLSEQGGAKDDFVDTLTFTTDLSVGVNAALKLNPVNDSFRLVSAGAHANASRIDIHKMTLSLVFPHRESPEAITGVERYDGDLNAPFDRPAPWRARYNLCVADARDREKQFNALRMTAPEVYCISYADNFAWQYGKAPPSLRIVVDQGGAAKIRSYSRQPHSLQPPEKRPNIQ